MIILNFKDNISTNKKTVFSFLSRKNKSNKSNITRENMVVNQKVFSVVTLRKADIDDPVVVKLLNFNKGKVLETYDKGINEKISSCLFDKTPYCKRALLSSLINTITSLPHKVSITVLDEGFVPCDEYNRLCSRVRSFALVTPSSASFQQFSDTAYYEYGLKISSVALSCNSDITVDFSNIDEYGDILVDVSGEKRVIHPDSSYYVPDDSVLRLLHYGVPIKCACAVIK